MFPNTVDYKYLGLTYLPVYTFPVNLFYPLVLLCVAKLRQKRLQRAAVQPMAGE